MKTDPVALQIAWEITQKLLPEANQADPDAYVKQATELLWRTYQAICDSEPKAKPRRVTAIRSS